MPSPDDNEVVLKAMLNGIGESAVKLHWVLSETNITKTGFSERDPIVDAERQNQRFDGRFHPQYLSGTGQMSIDDFLE